MHPLLHIPIFYGLYKKYNITAVAVLLVFFLHFWIWAPWGAIIASLLCLPTIQSWSLWHNYLRPQSHSDLASDQPSCPNTAVANPNSNAWPPITIMNALLSNSNKGDAVIPGHCPGHKIIVTVIQDVGFSPQIWYSWHLQYALLTAWPYTLGLFY